MPKDKNLVVVEIKERFVEKNQKLREFRKKTPKRKN
jgi:hypothetical protein